MKWIVLIALWLLALIILAAGPTKDGFDNDVIDDEDEEGEEEEPELKPRARTR